MSVGGYINTNSSAVRTAGFAAETKDDTKIDQLIASINSSFDLRPIIFSERDPFL